MTAENALWYKGKRKVATEFLSGFENLMDGIASRGFSRLPGFAKKAATGLELAAKLDLSELNYTITQQAVERSLRQSGVDYDLAYQQAAIDWELEKQGLLSALQTELAGAKRNREVELEQLERQMIELSLRQFIIDAMKTAIQVSMEGYQQVMALADADVPAYEVQLANQRLLTAQKKLELIPYIEAVIAAETTLIDEYDTLYLQKKETERQRLAHLAYVLTAISKRSGLLVNRAGLLTAKGVTDEKQADLIEKDAEVLTAETTSLGVRDRLTTEKTTTDSSRSWANNRAERVATEEGQYLVEEGTAIEKDGLRVLAETEVITKQGEYATELDGMEAIKNSYVTALQSAIAKDARKLELALQKTVSDRAKIDADITLIDASTELTALRETLENARVSLALTEGADRIAITTAETANKYLELEAMGTAQSNVLTKESSTASILLDTDNSVAGIENTTRTTSSSTRKTSEIDKIQIISGLEAHKEEMEAEIAASAKISNLLKHVLSA